MADSAHREQLRDRGNAWLRRFAGLLEAKARTVDELATLFAPECFWRDLLAFTWNIKTMEGIPAIAEMLSSLGPHPTSMELQSDPTEDADGFLEAFFTFSTESLRCIGHFRLGPAGCWTLLTAGRELIGHEECAGLRRPEGRSYGAAGRQAYCAQRQQQAQLGISQQPYVLIVGGGQCGLALGARLKRLQVPTLIVDRHERAGDCWRKRYRALHIHDPIQACHLPYLPFPDHWPRFPSKDQIADWLEAYVNIMELEYWAQTTCLRATWDEEAKEWLVQVDRKGQQIELRPKHLVLATGLYGAPRIPHLPGRDSFLGAVMHSAEYSHGDPYRGKRAVVVGSNTSAHDICEDLWASGANVTMVQRSPSNVIKINTQLAMHHRNYSDEALAKGMTADKADLLGATVPYRVVTRKNKVICDEVRARDAAFYERLEKAGFRLDFGEDGTGNVMMFLRRGSGYYIDIGASDLVARGAVKVVAGDVRRFSADGVVLADGTGLPADLVVLATGFEPLQKVAAGFLGERIVEQLGDVWGLGSGFQGDPGPWEGEQRNMWKPTHVPGLWIQGGNLSMSRFYSQFLALQLKARHAGVPTPVYGL